MFTKNDYQNLANVMARGQYNGIGEAAAAVALFDKLQKAIADADKPVDAMFTEEPHA